LNEEARLHSARTLSGPTSDLCSLSTTHILFPTKNVILIIHNVFYSPFLKLPYAVLMALHCCAVVHDNSYAYRSLSSSETVKVTPQCHIRTSHCPSNPHAHKEHSPVPETVRDYSLVFPHFARIFLCSHRPILA